MSSPPRQVLDPEFLRLRAKREALDSHDFKTRQSAIRESLGELSSNEVLGVYAKLFNAKSSERLLEQIREELRRYDRKRKRAFSRKHDGIPKT